MAEDVKYVVAIGFVQFDKQVREANGKTVTDVTIKTPGGEGVLVRVSIWEEFDPKDVDAIQKGDLLAVDGKFSLGTWNDKDTGDKRSQAQISATSLNINGKRVEKADREVVTATTSF